MEGQLRPGGHVERDPGTEGVAEQIAASLVAQHPPHGLGHQRRGGGQVRPHLGRPTVAGEVHRHQGVLLGQALTEGAPEAPRLREPVQQGQRWPGPADLDLEWHGR